MACRWLECKVTADDWLNFKELEGAEKVLASLFISPYLTRSSSATANKNSTAGNYDFRGGRNKQKIIIIKQTAFCGY